MEGEGGVLDGGGVTLEGEGVALGGWGAALEGEGVALDGGCVAFGVVFDGGPGDVSLKEEGVSLVGGVGTSVSWSCITTR